jgi:predicted cobalt transporter CbtA
MVTGFASQSTAPAANTPQELPAAEAEKRQGIWWYVLLVGLVLLSSEMVIANYLSRTERFL